MNSRVFERRLKMAEILKTHPALVSKLLEGERNEQLDAWCRAVLMFKSAGILAPSTYWVDVRMEPVLRLLRPHEATA